MAISRTVPFMTRKGLRNPFLDPEGGSQKTTLVVVVLVAVVVISSLRSKNP